MHQGLHRMREKLKPLAKTIVKSVGQFILVYAAGIFLVIFLSLAFAQVPDTYNIIEYLLVSSIAFLIIISIPIRLHGLFLRKGSSGGNSHLDQNVKDFNQTRLFTNLFAPNNIRLFR